jgi:hypothetical protein
MSTASALMFLPASDCPATNSLSKSKLLYDWQFTANQFLLASSPLSLTTRDFFPLIEPLRSLCNILSDEKMGLSPMNMLGLPSSVRIAHVACYCKFLLLHYTQVFCQYRLYKADHAYLTYLTLQRPLSDLNGRKLDHRQVSASLSLSLIAPSDLSAGASQKSPFLCCYLRSVA